MFAILDHSGPSLLEGGAVVQARWFLCVVVPLAVALLTVALLAAG